ncbi:MAG: citrate/2-methylcitrate synthase, partial [Thermoplasmatales archaeon]
MTEKPIINYGLEGVYVDESSISLVDGLNGKLWYRGYSIEDLAEKSNFEEVTYLLIYGKLPTRAELNSFKTKLAERMELPQEIIDLIRLIATRTHPMDVMRTAASMLSVYDQDPLNRERDATIDKIITLLARLPLIAALTGRFRRGLPPINPDRSLSIPSNFLYVLNGKKPNDFDAKLI